MRFLKSIKWGFIAEAFMSFVTYILNTLLWLTLGAALGLTAFNYYHSGLAGMAFVAVALLVALTSWFVDFWMQEAERLSAKRKAGRANAIVDPQ